MSDQCSVCDAGTLAGQVVPFVFPHGGKQTTIEDHQTVCNACGAISYVGEQISRHELAVAAKVRELDGLLSAEDLRRFRLKYKFRQTDLEAMLSVGPKTWTRWERGKVTQSKTADTLIRVLADDPEVARNLMQQARIDNADASEVFAAIDEDTKRLAEANLRTQMGPLTLDMNPGDLAQRAIAAVRKARLEWRVEAA
jgi:putative zinc finger/helix-turn-helix YgiT family protein